MRPHVISPLLLLVGACAVADTGAGAGTREIAALRAEVAALKAAAPAPPELGTQMLELQIRHARLWQAGQARNWLLAQFQLAELRETFNGVVESNGEHAALQPQRLAELLPAMVGPGLAELQAAIDARDGGKFDAGYDALSAGCNRCHTVAGHGFLVIQRPRTPVLDNLRAEPGGNE